jgi:hypothetical protein
VASILISRIEYIRDHPGGNFFTGDILEVYADPDLMDGTTPTPVSPISTGMNVNLNGVAFPDPSPALVFSAISPTYVSIQFTNPQICKSITLCVFEPSLVWPYTRYFNFFNHSSCQVNPPTCDLIIIGVPVVVSASSQTDSDGQITINATSSNPIQYKIGSNFSYDDGTAQTSNNFSGLLTGTYRIYLRDSDNCGNSVLVEVPFGLDFGERFRFEYDDFRSNQTRILINKRSYVDASTEVHGGGSAFQISMTNEGSENKFEPLTSVKGQLELRSVTDGQFLELYTNDPNLYRLEYWKDFGSGFELLFTSKVLPQRYAEEFKAPPYSVSIESSCGLPELKDFYLIQADGQPYFGTISLIKLVAHCLSVLKFNLNIRVSVNLYSTDMDQGDDDDPFDQAYIDFQCFYIANNEPDFDFVMRSILEPFGARIIQWGNRWNIVRVEEMIDSYDYREFDSIGDFIESGSYNPVKELDYPSASNDLKFVEGNQGIEMRPGYGNITVKYSLGLKPNIFKNGDFRLTSTYIPFLNGYIFAINKDGWILVNAGYAISEGYEKVDTNNVAYTISADQSILTNPEGGNAYLQSDPYFIKMGTSNSIKLLVRYKVDRVSAQFVNTIYTIDVPYVKLRMRVKYGSLYLQGNGSWTTDENILTFHGTEFNKYLEVQITAQRPADSLGGTPDSGMDFDIRVYHAFAYHAQFRDIDDLTAFETYDSPNETIPTGYKTELIDSSVVPGIMYYELEENTDSESIPNIVRPDDYHAVDNPRQWILKAKRNIGGTVIGIDVYPMSIDRIVGEFLVNGKAPFDSIVRNAKAEVGNRLYLEKDLVIGSYSELITTQADFIVNNSNYKCFISIYYIFWLVA